MKTPGRPVYSSESEAFRQVDRLKALGLWPGVVLIQADPPEYQLTWDTRDLANIGSKGYENT